MADGARCTVLHIRSDQKVFCAGADLKEVRARMDAPDGADRMYAYVAGIQRLYARIERLPQVTLAEIGGAAMGGGFELALACDLRIAATEAKLGLPEAAARVDPRRRRNAASHAAMRPVRSPQRLILGAEIIDGATADTLGVVHWSAPRAELAQRPPRLLTRIADFRPLHLQPARTASQRPCQTTAADIRRIGIHPAALLNDAETQQARRCVSCWCG